MENHSGERRHPPHGYLVFSVAGERTSFSASPVLLIAGADFSPCSFSDALPLNPSASLPFRAFFYIFLGWPSIPLIGVVFLCHPFVLKHPRS